MLALNTERGKYSYRKTNPEFLIPIKCENLFCESYNYNSRTGEGPCFLHVQTL